MAVLNSAQQRPAVIPPANRIITLKRGDAWLAQQRPAVIPPANWRAQLMISWVPNRSTKAGGHPAGKRTRHRLARAHVPRSTKAGGHPAGKHGGQQACALTIAALKKGRRSSRRQTSARPSARRNRPPALNKGRRSSRRQTARPGRPGRVARLRSTKAGGHPAGKRRCHATRRRRVAVRSTKAGGHPAGKPGAGPAFAVDHVGRSTKAGGHPAGKHRPADHPRRARQRSTKAGGHPAGKLPHPLTVGRRRPRSTKAGGHPAGKLDGSGSTLAAVFHRSTKAGGHPAGKPYLSLYALTIGARRLPGLRYPLRVVTLGLLPHFCPARFFGCQGSSGVLGGLRRSTAGRRLSPFVGRSLSGLSRGPRSLGRSRSCLRHDRSCHAGRS
jgi:hypothetical protein